MPAGGSAVDNFAAGGVAAPIDGDTGVLGIAVAKNPSRPSMRAHPDSGTPITGQTIPMWSAAKALALRAHAMFPDMPTVGWDVAMTPAGPVLLEANPVWCVELAQMTHGQPLGQTRLPELVLSSLGAKKSNGNSGALLWRRLYFRARWKANRTPIRRAVLMTQQLLWPLTAAVSSVTHASYSGVAARRDGAPVIPMQIIASWCIAIRHRVWPAGYYRYRLHDPKRRPLAREFIDEQEGIELLQLITRSGERWILDDKRRFADACARFGIPHAQAVACFENGVRVDAARDQRLVLPEEDLFIKSASLFSGAGIEQWKWRAAEKRYERDGECLIAEEVIARVIERSRTGHNGNAGRTVLIQIRIRNHERLAGYSPGGAVCTVRIVTARPKGGEPEFISAALRMPSIASDIDNFGAGGLAAPIDADTGVLGAALKLYLERVDVKSHPLSGAAIDGNVIPFWQACRELCVSAHQKFPTVFSVGWDVAVTPEGPLLLEANPIWGIEVTQMAHGKPLGLTRLPKMVRTWVD
nr:hypothetical protein [Chthoniobacterales bacterium]